MIFNNKKLITNLFVLSCTLILISISRLSFAEENTLSEIREEINEIQEILFAPNQSQLAIILAVNVDTQFKLDSVSLTIDDKKIKTYLYTNRESTALLNNAVHNIYVGDLKPGKHIIKATFSAFVEKSQSINISTQSKFTKSDKTKYIELEISKSTQQDVPVFNIKIWE